MNAHRRKDERIGELFEKKIYVILVCEMHLKIYFITCVPYLKLKIDIYSCDIILHLILTITVILTTLVGIAFPNVSYIRLDLLLLLLLLFVLITHKSNSRC